MGMFDHLRCHYPLPLPGLEEALFQTKDLDCQLDTYEIRADGTLWGEDYEYEDRSDPEATGVARLSGMLTRVNERPKFCRDFTGELEFHTDYGPTRNGFGLGWVIFRATFAAGHLRALVLVDIQKAIPEAGSSDEEAPPP